MGVTLKGFGVYFEIILSNDNVAHLCKCNYTYINILSYSRECTKRRAEREL